MLELTIATSLNEPLSIGTREDSAIAYKKVQIVTDQPIEWTHN